MKTKILLVLTIMLFAFQSCNKTENEEEPQNNDPAQALTPEKKEVSPFEIVTLTMENNESNTDSVIGIIGGEEVTLYTYDNELVFIVPDIPSGLQILTLTIESKAYLAEFNVKALSNVSNPETYVEDYIETLDGEMEELENLINELGGIIDPNSSAHDLAIIQNYIEEASQQLENANAGDILIAANFISSNKIWMDSIDDDINELKEGLSNLLFLKKNSKEIKDFEKKIDQAMRAFLKAVKSTIKRAKKMAVLVAGGIIIGGPFGGAIAGIMIGTFLVDLAELYRAEEELLDYVYSVGDDPFLSDKYELEFVNNQVQQLPVAMNYHNINNQYISTSFSLLADLVGIIDYFAERWNFIMSFLPDPLQMTPRYMSQITNITSTNAPVHANYLSISNISNSAVSVSVQNFNGEFLVAFTTNETSDIDFTFDLEYDHPDVYYSYTNLSAKLVIEAVSDACPGIPTVTHEGQVYNTVQIGNQCWLKENLNYETGNSWCYENDIENCNEYGRLYDWNTAMTACPEGWHLPSSGEWDFLANNIIGNEDFAGGELKEEGFDHWLEPNMSATDNYGFTALPGGSVYQGSTFGSLSENAYFWTSSPWTGQPGRAYYSHMNYNSGSLNILKYGYKEDDGYSVRCIKN